MTNLKIKLTNSSIETVTTPVIAKLYELAKNGEDVELSGYLKVNKAYGDLVDYLNNNFGPDLVIDATVRYISFEDPAVLQICVTNWGDGVGITEDQAATAELSNQFQNNTNITTFKEFKYFTKANTNPPRGLFSGCSNLIDIDLSRAIIINNNLFNGDLNLSIAAILPNVTLLGENCFYRTSIYGELNLPKLITYNGFSLFRECSSITKVKNLGKINKTSGNMFYQCTNLLEVCLPYECTEIGRNTFYNCTSLTTIKQYNSSVDDWASEESNSYFPNLSKITVVNAGSFENVPITLTLDDIINIITFYGSRDKGFCGKKQNNLILLVENLNLPNCRTIGGNTFYGMTSIKTVNLPNITTFDGNGTFAYCTNLEEATLNDRITTIGGDFEYGGFGAFEGCTKLERVVLPLNLTNIANRMFAGCTKLTNINIPTTLTSLGSDSFPHTLTSLKKPLYFPNVSGEMPYRLGGPSFAIYLPKITSTVVADGEWFWKPQSSLFSYRNETHSMLLLYLKDITSFGVCTFHCVNINTLIINNTTPPTLVINDAPVSKWTSIPTATTDVFANIEDILNIYVPDSAVDDYKNNSLYSSLASKIKPLSECPRITIAQAEAGLIGLIEEYM